MSTNPATFNYVHCDVFAAAPYSGNSLAVFTDSEALSAQQMLTITQELRHFESIFLSEVAAQTHARIFDLFEELPFAGHPILGAACTLHQRAGIEGARDWTFHLKGGRELHVSTELRDGRFFGTLDQGRPEMLGQAEATFDVAKAFNLDHVTDYPLEVISTGLKYLVVPVDGGLAEALITIPDLEERLRDLGAEFAYLFDVKTFEGRHWNNDGILEDVATGSAAGVVGAYALKHGLAHTGQPFTLKQGHFMGRPSEIRVTPYGAPQDVERVTVTGEVAFVGRGEVIAP